MKWRLKSKPSLKTLLGSRPCFFGKVNKDEPAKGQREKPKSKCEQSNQLRKAFKLFEDDYTPGNSQ
jgi:hypothetical protein